MSELSSIEPASDTAEPHLAKAYDRATDVAVLGFAAALVVAAILTLLAEEPAQYASNLWRSLPALVLISVAGFVTVFNPPGTRWRRNLITAAALQLLLPVVTVIAALSTGSQDLVLVAVLTEALISPTMVLGIFTILAVRYKHAMGSSPAMAVAGLVFASVMEGLIRPLSYVEWIGPGRSIAYGLASFGTLSLLIAAALVVVDRQSHRLASLLRSFVWFVALASAASFVIELMAETTDRSSFIPSLLPRTFVILGATAGFAIIARAQAPPTGQPAVIGLGATIAVGALFFWPLGIAATSLACRAIVADERGDTPTARRLAAKARTYRAWTIGCGVTLLVLAVLIGT